MPWRWKLFLRRFIYLVLAVFLINISFTIFLPSGKFLQRKFVTSTAYTGPTRFPPVPCSYPPTPNLKIRNRWVEVKNLNCSNERSEDVEGWEKSKNRNLEVYINDETLKKGQWICETEEADVVIVVFSAPESFARRDAIRKTWAVFPKYFVNTRVGFLLGRTSNATAQSIIDKESLLYKDIIQENFIDSKKNMTIKSVMMLKWFISNCLKARYLMKTDDNMVVIVSNLAKTLDSLSYPRVALFGMTVFQAVPFTNPNHEWYVPKYMYEKSVYPDFLSGKGYVMSKSVAVRLFMTSLRTPLVHLEDVFLTGICAEKAGIPRLGNLAFSYETYDCLPKSVITAKVSSPEFLRMIWSSREHCHWIVRSPVPDIY